MQMRNDAMKNPARPNDFLLYGKVAFTSGLLYLLLTRLDAQQASNLLNHTHISALLLAIAVHALVFLCGNLRWWLLLRHIQPACSFGDTAPAYYLGLFCNNFLPTGFGGDVVRVTYLSARNHEVSKLISSTLVDRVLGLVVLLLTGLLAIPMQNIFSEAERQALLLLTGAVLATMALVFSGWLLAYPILVKRFHQNGAPRQPVFFLKIHKAMSQFLHLIRLYQQAPWLLLSGVAFSLLIQALVILVYAILGDSLGIELPLASYFLMIPLVMLATNVPFSLGGLGLREGALVAMLVGMGVDYQQGVLLSLLYLLVLWLTTLPGGLILLKIRF